MWVWKLNWTDMCGCLPAILSITQWMGYRNKSGLRRLLVIFKCWNNNSIIIYVYSFLSWEEFSLWYVSKQLKLQNSIVLYIGWDSGVLVEMLSWHYDYREWNTIVFIEFVINIAQTSSTSCSSIVIVNIFWYHILFVCNDYITSVERAYLASQTYETFLLLYAS